MSSIQEKENILTQQGYGRQTRTSDGYRKSDREIEELWQWYINTHPSAPKTVILPKTGPEIPRGVPRRIEHQEIAVSQQDSQGETPDQVTAKPENQWVATTLLDAINKKWLDPNDYTRMDFPARWKKAIEFQIQHYWYFFFHEEVKKWMAQEFKRITLLTDDQMYQLMRANDFEPWMSVLAYNGSGYIPLSPKSPDSRTRYFYDIEYPFDAYLIQYWWPTWGNTAQHGLLDKSNFSFRISHKTGNVNLLVSNLGEQIDEAGKNLKKKWDDDSGWITFGIFAVIGVAGLGSTAYLVSELKK